jgi:stage II sporulation protein AB (anti-sigma F factor)
LVEIKISDNGKGIENVEKARQALYTSKPEMERSGMGFTLMESFMDSLDVKNNPEGGLTVRMQKTIAYIWKKMETIFGLP